MPAFNSYTTAASAGASDTTLIWQGGTVKQIAVGNLFSSPAPIGSTTPSTGAFTTLSVGSAGLSSNGTELRVDSGVIRAHSIGGWGKNGTLTQGTHDGTDAWNASVGLFVIGGNIFLRSEAANTLAMRNGTNAQELRLYSTYSGATDYSRVAFKFNGGHFELKAEGAGTGVTPDIRIARGAAIPISIGGGGIGIGLNLSFNPHNTSDIGSLTNSPRDVYIGRNLTIGGGTPIKQVISAAAALTLDSGGGPTASTNLTVTGAQEGDVVVLGLPANAVDYKYVWTAYVSAANTVFLQVSSVDGSGISITATIRATVIRH